MSQYVYVNGAYVPREEARISVFDRGFLMADAIYEVTAVLQGRLIDFPAHCARLERSLQEMEIANPHDAATWLSIHREIVARNDVTEGSVYVEITRGDTGQRGFDYPEKDVAPTVVVIGDRRPGLASDPAVATGWKIATIHDLRWHRRDIKTTQLVYPSYAKMTAVRKGADDAWLVEDGFVTEGTSNNAYIVRQGRIITRPLSHDILHGITRAALLRFAKETNTVIEERKFTVAEAQDADEAFVTSATAFVMPVTEIDGIAIGDGKPGPVTMRLREVYFEESLKSAL